MKAILPGARELSPLKQGDLSGLCGLYSMMNAVQLVLYPRRLTQKQQHGLFAEGISVLSRHRALKGVLGAGMDENLWEKIGRALVEKARADVGSSLRLRRLLVGQGSQSGRLLLKAIERALAGGSPVLICLGGTLDHYTVVCGSGDRTLKLFDSSGLNWIGTHAIGLGEDSGFRRWIWPECVYALRQS